MQLWTALDVCLFVMLVVKSCEAADCLMMWWQRSMINDVVCCEMFNGSQNQFFTSTQDTTLYALCMHVSCMRLRIFRKFQEMCAYRILFPHKSPSSTAIVIFLVFFYYQAISIGFVTSTIWLPIEWHRPCVRTPVERDGVVGFKQFCAISATYLVFMQFAQFFLNDALNWHALL